MARDGECEERASRRVYASEHRAIAPYDRCSPASRRRFHSFRPGQAPEAWKAAETHAAGETSDTQEIGITHSTGETGETGETTT